MTMNVRLFQAMMQLQFMNTITSSSASSNAPYASMDTGAAGGVDFASLFRQLALQEGTISPNQAPSIRNPRTAAAYHPAMKLVQSASPTAFDSIIEQSGARHGVDGGLIKAVVHAESSFNPNAVSHAGAKGLMQLMDGTAKMLGVKDSMDPKQNVDGGTRYLRDLLKQFKGNVGTALAAYNAGPGTMAKLGIQNDAQLQEKYHQLPKETQGYVQKVMDLYRTYQA